MKNYDNKILIFGIGNISRQDDGIGWMFLDHIKEKKYDHIDIEYRYQLQIEDAELICHYKTVIFIDACKNETKTGFYLKRCTATDKFGFSTHELKPETVLYLANNLYAKKPDTFIFGIKGYQWNLENGLTSKAKENFEIAKDYFYENILNSLSLKN